MSIDIDKERFSFEAWARTDEGNCNEMDLRKWLPKERQAQEGETYCLDVVERDWTIWLAAKRHAAQVAEPSGASVEGEARDAARWEYIEGHASTEGGGKGFTISCFIPFDEEDMGVGVDRAIAAMSPNKEG